MMTPTEEINQGLDVAAELKRITTSTALAFLLLMVAVLLDGPVSILAWVLVSAAFLCLAYIFMASRQLLIQFRSQDNRADPND